MADTKGISVQVPVDLHARVKAEQERLEMTMSEYIQQVLEEHFTPKFMEKGGNDMSGNARTLAFQVSEELFQRVKHYLSKHPSLTQKSFVIGLIEKELERFEAEPAPVLSEEELRRRSFDPLTGEYGYPAGQGEAGEDRQDGAEGGEAPQGGAESGEDPQDGDENGDSPDGGGEGSEPPAENEGHPGAEE